ncbi:MAG: hypothetical protein QM479_07680 [Pseudomonadota bacterium]
MNKIIFSLFPGSRERQLKRKYQNIIFPENERDFSANRLESAQYSDEQDRLKFEQNLHQLVEKIANMDANVSSEIVLDYKEKLDMAFAEACCLCAEQLDNKKIILQLINVLMKAIWQGAIGDEVALKNLEEEEIAREQHVDLLQIALIADLLAPRSAIAEDELVPVLLSESQNNLANVVNIFTPEQQHQIYIDAKIFLQQISDIDQTHAAWKNLQIIKSVSLKNLN